VIRERGRGRGKEEVEESGSEMRRGKNDEGEERLGWRARVFFFLFSFFSPSSGGGAKGA